MNESTQNELAGDKSITVKVKRKRPKPDEWAQIRAERESGVTFGELARRHGITKSAITNRSTREKWGDGRDIGAEIRRRVSEKVSRVVSVDPAKKSAAIDAEAGRVADVVIKHREEWTEHRTLFPTAEIKKVFDIGKSAKISAEMITLRQRGERIAWGLEDSLPKDLSKLSDAEIDQLLKSC